MSHRTRVVTFHLSCDRPRAWLVLTSDTAPSTVVEMGRERHPQQSMERGWSASPALVPADYRCRFYSGDGRNVFYHGPAPTEGSVDCGMDAVLRVTARDGSGAPEPRPLSRASRAKAGEGSAPPKQSTRVRTMANPKETSAEEIAHAVAALQRQRTGHEPKSVSVVLGGDTLVVTIHGALSPAEVAMARTPEGAEKVQEFHRRLFLSASDALRGEVKRITGMDVRGATVDVNPPAGAVVQAFSSGTMVQVLLLSGNVPPGSFLPAADPTNVVRD